MEKERNVERQKWRRCSQRKVERQKRERDALRAAW